MGKEWALVLFTLLAQMSVGLMVVAQALNLKQREGLKPVLLWVGILMAASMVVSLGHLGSPLGAPRAIFNLKTSWLSREIFFSAGFFVLWLVNYYLELRTQAGEGVKAISGWLAGFCGILALISMANIYVHTILPAWETAYTHLVFYTTALVLGAILYAVLAYRNRQEGQQGMLKITGILTVIGVALQLLSLPPYLASLSAGPVAAQETARLLLGAAPVLIFSQALAVLGGIVFTFLALRAYGEKGSLLTGQWLYGALALLVLAELASRYLFYATGVSITIGQF
ncbi:dimethyl sulfoxide reductase anchor subunit family protein [Neomoorella thermoacetica]|uniref:dimethyl sulfoxide reductase anchor subunit family protein n=1 Tax=Neomoorella thermoacetica TaxID=1525 RepID=UPI0008FAFD7A|nr:DmsC/YnfH family molybdoenzyme membrane anchor subunit [Moorella thermoacetica]OIQ54280.1 DMSO reductase anchor subunit (DmsC) [Moorella thermoacetica]OIQ61352.1 DMSO reductase anchor subunit (DmsC) [Moorella thermoacetica]